MVDRYAFTAEERHLNTIKEIEYSDLYEELTENGGSEYLLKIFNEVISMLSQRIRQNRCDKEFTENEVNKLSYEMKCALKICQLPDTHFACIIKYL